MLEGVSSNDIIVGAYTARDGGICPMLAAHRCGGRTDFVSFAHAWDRFAEAKRMRRATDRELTILISHLESSLLAEQGSDLSGAIAEHRVLLDRVPRSSPAPGDSDRRRELRHRPGWSWMRPFRRLDDYERALERLDVVRREVASCDTSDPQYSSSREQELTLV